MNLRSNVRNFMCGLTLDEMQRELDVSNRNGLTERAKYIKEFMEEVRAEEVQYPSEVPVSRYGTVFAICFRNKSLNENHMWVFTDRDTYEKGLEDLKQDHLEILASGNADVKGNK